MTPRSRRRKPICLTTWPRELRIVALAATAVALLCAIGAVVAPAVGLYPRGGRLDAGKVAITELPQRHALPGPAAAVRRPRHGQMPSAPARGRAAARGVAAAAPSAAEVVAAPKRPTAPRPASPPGADPPKAPTPGGEGTATEPAPAVEPSPPAPPRAAEAAPVEPQAPPPSPPAPPTVHVPPFAATLNTSAVFVATPAAQPPAARTRPALSIVAVPR